jgi:hypothetical protein
MNCNSCVTRAHLDKVAESFRGAGGGGVDVLDAGELQHLLGGDGGDDASTAGRGDQADGHGPALAGDLRGDGVGSTELSAPVPAADRDDVQLGQDHGTRGVGGTSCSMGKAKA